MVVDEYRIDVLALLVAVRYEEDLDAFQFVGRHATVDPVLVTAAGAEEESRCRDSQE